MTYEGVSRMTTSTQPAGQGKGVLDDLCPLHYDAFCAFQETDHTDPETA